VLLFHRFISLFFIFDRRSRENDEGAMVKREGILVTSAFISRLAFQEMTSSPVFSTAKNYSAAPGARNVSSWEYEITNERSSGVRGRGCWKIERTKVSVHKLRWLTRVCVSYPVFCGGVAQVTFVYEQYRVASGDIFQGDRKLFFLSSRILDTGCLFLILRWKICKRIMYLEW